MSRHCPRCDLSKPVDDFGIERSRKDGRSLYCKSCRREMRAEYAAANPDRVSESRKRTYEAHRSEILARQRREYAANPERKRAQSRKWATDNAERKSQADRAYRAANQERVRANAKAWAEKNKESRRRSSREWVARNAEKVARSGREWEAKNPEKSRAKSQRRRARLASGAVYAITERDLRRIYSQPCEACGAVEGQTFDHRIPIARGGSHGIGNAMTLCGSCNSSKSDSLLVEWRYRDVRAA